MSPASLALPRVPSSRVPTPGDINTPVFPGTRVCTAPCLSFPPGRIPGRTWQHRARGGATCPRGHPNFGRCGLAGTLPRSPRAPPPRALGSRQPFDALSPGLGLFLKKKKNPKATEKGKRRRKRAPVPARGGGSSCWHPWPGGDRDRDRDGSRSLCQPRWPRAGQDPAVPRGRGDTGWGN